MAALPTNLEATALKVGGGVAARLSRTVGLYLEADYATDIDANKREAIKGSFGLRVNW